jgi:hypothetical protein
VNSFRATYDRYRPAAKLSFAGRERTAALAAEEELDTLWDEASRMMPPIASLGQVYLTSRHRAFFLHAVARQAVWPDEEEERASWTPCEFLLGRALARVQAEARRNSGSARS